MLAHIAGDKHMIEAFKNNVDIHTNTAMRVFGITNPDDVTSEMRRQAKAVNFGIVYGISDYGLSQNLNISRKRAKRIYRPLFGRVPRGKRLYGICCERSA